MLVKSYPIRGLKKENPIHVKMVNIIPKKILYTLGYGLFALVESKLISENASNVRCWRQDENLLPRASQSSVKTSCVLLLHLEIQCHHNGLEIVQVL